MNNKGNFLMDDDLVLDLGIFFAASKRQSYRRLVATTFTTYINFLQGHGLTTRTLLAAGDEVTADTKIWKSDLTEEGVSFVRRAEQKWLRAIDRGKAPTNTKMLEKELAKLRESPEEND
jgi:hypothetical protein